MKKLFLLFLALSCLFSHAQGQRKPQIHLIIAAGTDEPDISKGCFADVITVNATFSNMALHADWDLKKYYVGESNFKPDMLERKIAALQSSSSDIIVFYYTGHGQDDPNSPWPTFVMGHGKQRYPKDLMNFTKVKQLLQRKPAHLRVVIADCCNSPLPDSELKDAPAMLAAKGSSTLDPKQKAFFKSLLEESSGDIWVASSSEGEEAYTSRTGSIYTNCLDEVIRMLSKEGGKGNWKQVIAYAKGMTGDVLSASHSQTPYSELNIGGATLPPSSPTPTPTPSTEAEDDSYLTSIRSMLDGSTYQRYQKMNTVLSLFESPNAIVEIYDAKGRTRLDRESAEMFLERIAVTASIADLVALGAERNEQGKITKLKIHEYYKK